MNDILLGTILGLGISLLYVFLIWFNIKDDLINHGIKVRKE